MPHGMHLENSYFQYLSTIPLSNLEKIFTVFILNLWPMRGGFMSFIIYIPRHHPIEATNQFSSQTSAFIHLLLFIRSTDNTTINSTS